MQDAQGVRVRSNTCARARGPSDGTRQRRGQDRAVGSSAGSTGRLGSPCQPATHLSVVCPVGDNKGRAVAEGVQVLQQPLPPLPRSLTQAGQGGAARQHGKAPGHLRVQQSVQELSTGRCAWYIAWAAGAEVHDVPECGWGD